MKEYLQMIIWMLIFVLIIEMIFPDSAYRKYIKLILGCILVYTLVQPVIKIINMDQNSYDDYVKYYQTYLKDNNVGTKMYEEQKQNQQDTLKEYYISGIKELVENEFKLSVIQVNIKINNNMLSKIDIVVASKSNQDIEIGTITIGDKSQSLEGDSEGLKNKIKTCLSNFYNVQVRNIHITVQKN